MPQNKIKVLKVWRTELQLIPVQDRWYRVAKDARCLLKTDCGYLHYTVKADFLTDMRSGGWLVDLIADHIGTQANAWTFTCHDLGFYDYGLSFETCNDIMRQQLIVDAGYSKFRAWLTYKGVCTDIARKSFGNNTSEEEANKKLGNIAWVDEKEMNQFHPTYL